jgi:hypothetical protein
MWMSGLHPLHADFTQDAYTAHSGCAACPAGKISQGYGQTECVACAGGKYQDKEAQYKCKAAAARTA